MSLRGCRHGWSNTPPAVLSANLGAYTWVIGLRAHKACLLSLCNWHTLRLSLSQLTCGVSWGWMAGGRYVPFCERPDLDTTLTIKSFISGLYICRSSI